jgi:hypothetical protein
MQTASQAGQQYVPEPPPALMTGLRVANIYLVSHGLCKGADQGLSQLEMRLYREREQARAYLSIMEVVAVPFPACLASLNRAFLPFPAFPASL